MKSFKYADESINERELMIAVASMVIGVSILSLPKQIAAVTNAADGWISIVVGGLLVALITWLGAKLAIQFPNQTFLTYASSIITKPVAIVLTFTFAVISLIVAVYIVRSIADLSKQYLFNETPTEVLALTFLLVVVYAVSSSRVGLFRLNVMFLPIIIFVSLVIIIFNIRWIEVDEYLPLFETSFTGYIKGIHASIISYMGFGIVLFYIALVEKPKKVPKMVVLGISLPIVLYLLVFMTAIGVFGSTGTANLLYPTIELAKIVEIPGGIIERIESIFFVIWSMAIFNTAAMGFDVAVLAFHSIFKSAKKMTIIFVLSPIVYYISLFPETFIQVSKSVEYFSYFAVPFTTSVIILLLLIVKVKGVKNSG